MNLYPAIDLYEGQVVRLQKGDFAKKTVYSSDPGAIAAQWEDQGAKWLHVVDLDGAKNGMIKNLPSLVKIRAATKCRIEIGGGVREAKDIQMLIDGGADRVILGTRALVPGFLAKALSDHGPRIAVGLDAINGTVQTQGWLESGQITLESAIAQLNLLPLETMIFTDIQKDGMLQGPNFDRLKDLMAISKAKVILSGGVATLDDIAKCRDLNHARFEGVIIGKALYEKRFTLTEAFDILRKK